VIAEKDTVPVPKHFSAHPGYHGLNDDSFMYSIHGTVKDGAPSQFVEEQPADMMCMFDNIPYLDCPPKWDQYDDDREAETEVVCSEKPAACHWQEEDHLPFRCDNQPLHNSHDSNEECAENVRVSEGTLSLCCSSFQFMKRNSRPVVNSEDKIPMTNQLMILIKDMEAVLNPVSQPLTDIDFRILDDSLEPEENSELIQKNSVPLCFKSFQVLKETFGQMLKDNYIKGQGILFESMQQSCQSFQDPIADQLDGICGQNYSSFSSHEIKCCYDIDMIRQSVQGCVVAEASVRNHQSIHSCSHEGKRHRRS
jgi:hypothetical protein